MRIAVVGAGAVGVASAYELACDGHKVTVFERRGSVAAESSFAPSGIAGAGPLLHAAASGALAAWQQLQPSLDLPTLRWAWQWHRAQRRAKPCIALLQLAQWGRMRMQALVQTLPLEVEQTPGHLLLLRERQDVERIAPALAGLAQASIAHRTLDAAQCWAMEPGLNPQAALHGAVHLPQDISGNCRQFSLMLRTAAEQRGVQFCFHHDVSEIQSGTSVRLTITSTPSGDTTMLSGAADSARLRRPASTSDHGSVGEIRHESFDAVVLCPAMGASALLASIGMRLPLAAVWGQSMTAPLRHLDTHPELAPQAAITDWRTGVTLTRIDTRLRAAGGSRLSHTAPASQPALWPTVLQALDTWYPGATRISHAQRWVGARTTVPDGLPVLGGSAVRGVWLNLAHGNAGWALACGSARALADQIAERRSPVATDAFRAQRFSR